jgi:Hydantoinase B/oxoprolinase
VDTFRLESESNAFDILTGFPILSVSFVCPVSNHPVAGGSHLPDITCITPVFDKGKLVFFTGQAPVPLGIDLWN